jgi:hypothetical protein
MDPDYLADRAPQGSNSKPFRLTLFVFFAALQPISEKYRYEW